MTLLFLKQAAAASLIAAASAANAAQGEMGQGVPSFGVYLQPPTLMTVVWSLGDATLGFPAGCTKLVLVASTMGMDSYKAALATMVSARLTNRKVRFVAHAVRDDGCGVDYVELL